MSKRRTDEPQTEHAAQKRPRRRAARLTPAIPPPTVALSTPSVTSVTTLCVSLKGRLHGKKRSIHVAEGPSSMEHPSSSTPTVTAAPTGSSGSGTTNQQEAEGGKKKRIREVNAASHLAHWLTVRDSCLDELLRHDGLGDFLHHEGCIDCHDVHSDLYKCRDCLHGYLLLCRGCIVSKHRDAPLHRVEKWNGLFFEKDSLSKLGLRVQLGHSSDLCTMPEAGPSHFVVFDTSGVHSVAIDYCGCPSGFGIDKRTQLLHASWFPATTARPQTAFSFALLDMYHELSLQSKTTIYDFYHTIIRLTDNANIKQDIYRYSEMHRVFRLWRNLMAMKRAGAGQNPLRGSGIAAGGLVVECPACPHPGRNLPDGWEKAGPLMFLYILYISVDANFKLKRKDRKVKDVDLMPGQGVYVDEAAYQAHIQNFVDQPETNTCESEHDAIVKASTRSTPGYAASGKGMVICSRHALVRKNGAGELQKGERYCNMDFIVLSALIGVVLPRLIITYDIACQWSKNLFKRMEDFPEEMKIKSGTKIDAAIPGWHINGHGQACRQKFCLGHLKGAGRTCGEDIETTWSHTNALSASIREMSLQACHETMSFHWNGWNFRKIVGFCALFLKRFKEAGVMKEKQEGIFDRLTATFKDETITKWTKMVEEWEANPNSPNPYEEPKSATTLQDVRLELARAESSQGSPQHKMSFTSFLITGLDIEDRQYILRTEISLVKGKRTSKQLADIEDKRNALSRQIQNWRQAQLVYTPYAGTLVAATLLGESETEGAENVNLHLPSSFPANVRSQPDMQPICEKERRLREAQAEDALADIRRLRRMIQGLWQFKKINVNGTGNRPNTQMLTLYNRMNNKVKRAANRYRSARLILAKLDPDGAWQERLKVLHDADIRGPGKESDEKVSNGRFEPSWIWLVPPTNSNRRTQSTESQQSEVTESVQTEAEFDDSMRAEWMKTRARMERWKEEFLIIQEEMRRVLSFFEWKADWWEGQSKLRLDAPVDVALGVSAYAHKQAFILRQMAIRCASRWVPELKKHDITPLWASQYASKIEPTKPQGRDPVAVSTYEPVLSKAPAEGDQEVEEEDDIATDDEEPDPDAEDFLDFDD